MKKVILIGIPVILLGSLLVYKTQTISNDVDLMADQENVAKEILPKGGELYNKNSRSNCLSEDCLAVADLDYPVSELPQNVVEALNKAIDDEYKAYSTYDSVITKFGSIRPFIMIIRAEEQHISSLKSIYDKYGLDIPENRYVGTISSPESLSAACSIGVQAEIDNASLYRNELLPAVKDYEDITLVFNNLMDASQTKHLPAFERCSN